MYLACGAAFDSHQEEEEVEAHAASLDAESFGVFVQTLRLEVLKGAEALCSKLRSNSETRLPDGDVVEDRFNFGDGASSKSLFIVQTPSSKMMLLLTSGFLHISSQTNHFQSR